MTLSDQLARCRCGRRRMDHWPGEDEFDLADPRALSDEMVMDSARRAIRAAFPDRAEVLVSRLEAMTAKRRRKKPRVDGRVRMAEAFSWDSEPDEEYYESLEIP